MSQSGEAKPPIDVPIQPAMPLPSAIANRLVAASHEPLAVQAADALADAILTGCDEAWRSLTGMHADYLDTTDLDPTGHSRAAAVWLVSGRCLGLLYALLAQVRAGVQDEALVTARAIHEGTLLTSVFLLADDVRADDLVRTWLTDESDHGYVKQRQARDAQDRYEDRLAEAMEAAGKHRLRPTWTISKERYALASRAVHSRRSSCLASYSPALRQMTYGWHPSPTARAAAADWVATETTTVIGCVGEALQALYGDPQFFSERVQPIQQRLDDACVVAQTQGAERP